MQHPRQVDYVPRLNSGFELHHKHTVYCDLESQHEVHMQSSPNIISEESMSGQSFMKATLLSYEDLHGHMKLSTSPVFGRKEVQEWEVTLTELSKMYSWNVWWYSPCFMHQDLFGTPLVSCTSCSG